MRSPDRGSVGPRRPAAAGPLVLALAAALCSCAYYNTFYLAKKYYDKGSGGLPYAVDPAEPRTLADYNKSMEFSKKLLAQYPDDKLIDDAYLLWARALLGANDPRQTVHMLEDFPTRYPDSPLLNEAAFYLGVGYRQSRKYANALRELDTFLSREPRHALTPYALLEKARALVSLERPGEAAATAGELVERFPRSRLADRARVTRAEAHFAQGAYDRARTDFQELGSRSRTDAQRLDYLLREADCLEAARKFDEELELLRRAIAHERAPTRADTSRGSALAAPGAAFEPYGRLLIRIGTALLLSGRHDEALESYRRVAVDYRRTPLGAEAQYRIGYAYETVVDDFDRARQEYAQVKDHGVGSTYASQADLRLNNLDRLAEFRSSVGDSVEKAAEAAFILAELYLFQLDKPERALEEYRKIAEAFSGTPVAAKATNAQAWVLSRKLKQDSAAESLFWNVVREFPATEAQLAARDYLEAAGVEVPSHLIKQPERLLARSDTLPRAAPPAGTVELGGLPGGVAGADSLTRLGPRPGLPAPPGLLFGADPPRAPGGDGEPRRPEPPRAAARRDTMGAGRPAAGDSGGVSQPPAGRRGPAAPPDSTGR